jgi:hypothetical protein
MPPAKPTDRPAALPDALCLSTLATQVFLDTYATQGIRPAIAREVHHHLSEETEAHGSFHFPAEAPSGSRKLPLYHGTSQGH